MVLVHLHLEGVWVSGNIQIFQHTIIFAKFLQSSVATKTFPILHIFFLRLLPLIIPMKRLVKRFLKKEDPMPGKGAWKFNRAEKRKNLKPQPTQVSRTKAVSLSIQIIIRELHITLIKIMKLG